MDKNADKNQNSRPKGKNIPDVEKSTDILDTLHQGEPALPTPEEERMKNLLKKVKEDSFF